MAKSPKHVQQELPGRLNAVLTTLNSVATWCAAALIRPRKRPITARHRKPTPLRKQLPGPTVLLTPVVAALISVGVWVVLAR
jgi:hypothetical protein